MRTRIICVLLAVAGFALAQTAEPPIKSDVVFGTTVVIPAGLHGQIYFIKRNSKRLPNLDKMKPKGSIYATRLNVPLRDFTEGFPGVTKRFEWFAIDYSGRFWIETPGDYKFELTSDDGSKLYIDGETIIDNDGVHPFHAEQGSTTLTRGIHLIRVSYFQGPRTSVGLVLSIQPPRRRMRIFDVDDFRPPPDYEGK